MLLLSTAKKYLPSLYPKVLKDSISVLFGFVSFCFVLLQWEYYK